MCQEKLKANATEAIFPSLQRRGRKQPDHMIETDDVKSTAVRKYRAQFSFLILLQELGRTVS